MDNVGKEWQRHRLLKLHSHADSKIL